MDRGLEMQKGRIREMKLAVISFTRQGSVCCRKLVKGFVDKGEQCTGYVQEKFLDSGDTVLGLVPIREPLAEWTGARFQDADGLIFVGAAGIAVRAIAPWLRDKRTDPAVAVVDQKAAFSISLLSGHIGGANRLAEEAAAILGARPVITTATDIEGKTAIDVLAKEAGLKIADWGAVKLASAELLEGNPVGFFSDYRWPSELPDGFTQKENCRVHVWVTARQVPQPGALISLFLTPESLVLRLVPPVFCVGIGCRRGTAAAVIRQAVREVMNRNNLAVEGITAVASIDIKQDEAGLIALANELEAGFVTFTKQELEAVAGAFSASAFVKEITGVDNVCERAALACGGSQAELLIKKRVVNGVTVAVARKPWKEEVSLRNTV